MELITRMIRLEKAGIQVINSARRRRSGAKYITMDTVLWCHDEGWVKLKRAPFEMIDWSRFEVTAKGYEAAGEDPPPWLK